MNLGGYFYLLPGLEPAVLQPFAREPYFGKLYSLFFTRCRLLVTGFLPIFKG